MKVETIRVLCLGDGDELPAEIRGHLARTSEVYYFVESLSDIESAQQVLVEGDYDVFLVEEQFAFQADFDLFDQVDASLIHGSVIVIGAEGNSDKGVRFLRKNVDDYLVRESLNRGTLLRSIRYALERKAQEHKIAEHTSQLTAWIKRYEAAIEATGQLMYECFPRFLNPQGPQDFTVEYMGNMEKVIEYESDEMPLTLGGWLALVHPADRPRVESGFRKSIKDLSTYSLEYRIQLKGTRYVYVNDRGHVIADKDGRVEHILGYLRNIDDQRRAFVIKEERNALREAVNAFDQVLGVVGHELRTPLGGLRAMSELLLRDVNRDGGEKMLQGIHDEVIRMSGIVNDLLEVARLNSGTAKWNWANVSLNHVGSEALASISPLVDRSSVTLCLNVEPDNLEMRGDGDAVRRLLINLLNNAYKHTDEGSILVNIRSHQEEDSSWISVMVVDSGRGISEKVVNRLGEPFALNSGVVGENFIKGSGIGLAICKGIAEAHGGAMEIRSRANVGTTVHVKLRADLERPVEFQRKRSIVGLVSNPATDEKVAISPRYLSPSFYSGSKH